MNILTIILLVLALASFTVACVLGDRRPGTWAGVRFVAIGLALWVLVQLLAALGVG